MTMIILLLCWFLFALPLMLAGAALLGARLYAMGKSGEIPAMIPKFNISRARTGNGQAQPTNRLPEV